MEFAIIIVTIFFLGVFIGANPGKEKISNYFLSPSTRELNFDWAVRQFFLLFSKKMCNRWYEARGHMHCGIFVSILVTLHIINVGRIMFELTEYDNRYESVLFVTHGFQSRRNILKNIDKHISIAKQQVTEDCFYYQTFISGYNVIHDFMTFL